MFENNNKLIDFSFNNNYMNNVNINSMKGMFSGCTSLTSISFYPFKGEDATDISFLFSDCVSLKSINF